MNRHITRESEMIRQARLRMGYSQQHVATMLGMQIRQYQRLECERCVEPATIVGLNSYLSLTSLHCPLLSSSGYGLITVPARAPDKTQIWAVEQ